MLSAAREPAEIVPVEDVPWPERVLAVRSGPLEIVNVHSPISPKPGLVKVLTHEAVFRHLAAGSGPRVVLGDLNTPRREHPDGTVWTFARERNGRLRADRGERWDAAESALIRGLEAYGFRDAFRELNGFEAEGAELGMAPFGRRLPPGPPDRIRRSNRHKLLLPPRLAPRRQALGPLRPGRGAPVEEPRRR